MGGPDRFFLFGYFGQGNLGDDLLLQATADGIRALVPSARFVVRNEGQIASAKTLGAPVELTDIDKILADKNRSRAARLIDTLRAYSAYFRRCEWFVFSGGTLFHERTSIQPLLLTLLVCLVALLCGVRIAALGVGVAELRSRRARLLFRAIVLLSDIFAVRDEAALIECRTAGVGTRVNLTGDLVFTMRSLHPRSPAGTTGKAAKTVGLSLYPPALSGEADLAAFRRLVAGLIARGWSVVLMSFQESMEQRDNGISDRSLFARILVDLPQDRRAMVSEVMMTAEPAQLAAAYSGIDVHCGMRFHGHVLAAIHGKPFVGISHDNKIEGICRTFDMPCEDIREMPAHELVARIEEASSRIPDPSRVSATIAAAAMNFALLSACLSARSGNRP